MVDATELERTVIPDKGDPVNKKIPLVEMFGPTVQGEGTVLGQQTYFLRFGLCDYRCKKCDSLHAVLPSEVKKNSQFITQQEIFDQFMAFRNKLPHSTNWVTFSGGNPAIHDLGYLLGLLKMAGMKVNVETQGTMWRGWLGKVDSLTISPKGPGMGETHNHKVFMGFMDKLALARRDVTSEAAMNGLPNLCIKIVAFDQRDLEFATDIFKELMDHELFQATDISDHFYLSLGNPLPPQPDVETVEWTHEAHMSVLLDSYRMLYEDIQNHPILSQVRFTPQWHVFVWGNGQGH